LLWVYLGVGVVIWLISLIVSLVSDGGFDSEEFASVWPIAVLYTIFIIALWPLAILILFAMALAQDG